MKKHLRIYYTSDTHGYLFAQDDATGTPKATGLLSCLADYRKDGNTLVIDGGDTFQGSPFAMYLQEQDLGPAMIAQVLNTGGYDYVTIGNHDIDYGKAYLHQFLTTLDAKCLCSNLQDSAGELPIFPSDIKVMANGLTIGIIGATTDHINIWAKPEHLKTLHITDPFVALQQALDRLKAQVDITIGVYHGGFERDVVTGRLLSDTTENIAYKIASELSFDLLLTGHQHLPLANTTINGTHVVQPPHKADRYVCIDLFTEADTTTITSQLVQPTGAYDPAPHRALLAVEAKVQAYLDQPIGRLSQALMPTDKLTMALQGHSLVDFLHQIQRHATGADISVTSLANDIKGFSQSVTIRDLVSTFVYPNTLVALALTGAMLKAAMERSCAYFDTSQGTPAISATFLAPKVEHYNYDYYSVGFTADLRKPVGQRVLAIHYKDKPLADTDTVTVVVSNYRATGTGGYPMYPSAKVLGETSHNITEILIDYFKAHEVVTVQPAPRPAFLF